MRASLFFLAVTPLLILSKPLPASFSTVSVHTPTQGTFVGASKAQAGLDVFQGIPFATPPLGALRFAKPQPLASFNGTRDAVMQSVACQQAPIRKNVEHSEDCLYLNIVRPIGVSDDTSLPVMVWHYGGAWQTGSNSDPAVHPEAFVARSIALDEPVILVIPNYRVGAFGFLAGPEMDAADAAGTAVLNAGYHDQQEALRWVQRNIESFGGDPSKVVIFGSSAGANGVAAQMLANGGRDAKSLFRGAIMQSGSQALGPRYPASSAVPTAAYNQLLKLTKCSDLQCLRNVPASAIEKANEVQILTSPTLIGYFPVLDRHFVEELPSEQFAAGRFPDMPFISGTNLDDGTMFAKLGQWGDAAVVKVLTDYFGTSSQPLHADLLKLYPDVAELGSPFEAQLVGASPNDRFYGPGNQYKRVAALLSDGIFNAGRRMQLEASVKMNKAKCWTYLFAQPTPMTMLLTKALGIDHASELAYVYATPPKAIRMPFNRAFATYASTADLESSANVMSAAWIHFANRLDPSGRDVPAWPEYGNEKSSLKIEGRLTAPIKDDFRAEQVAMFMNNAASFNM